MSNFGMEAAANHAFLRIRNPRRVAQGRTQAFGIEGVDTVLRKRLILLLLASILPIGAMAQTIPTSVSDDGMLLRGGQKVFPFGIYHVAWIGERHGEALFQDMGRIHRNGLGIMKTALDPTSRESDLELLDGAAKRDMGIMAELYLPSLGVLIDRMKDYAAIISWQIGDDFNVTKSQNYCTPQLLKQRHALARQHDTNHVTYASGGSALVEWYRSFKDYHGCVDMIGIQCYPVDKKPDFPDQLVLERCFQLFKARVMELENSGIVPIANLQSFSWKKKGIFPTPAESRSMLYGALSAGVKGVLYYTFYDGKNIGGNVTLDKQDPELWAEIGKQANEVRKLEAFLLHGQRRHISSHHKQVYMTIWTSQRKMALLVFNTDRKKTYELNEPIPTTVKGQMIPMFSDRPAGL